MRPFASALCLALIVPAGLFAQQQSFEAVEIKTTDLGSGLYMMEGAGGNLGVSVGEDGVVLIDDQFAPLSEKITAAIARLTDKPVTYLINTHHHGDHTGGNERFAEAGAVILAHDNVRARLSKESFSRLFGRTTPAASEKALPVLTYSEDATLHFNGLEVRIHHADPAHTDGDSFVHFPAANVLHTGDLFFNKRFPFIDVDSGGGLAGMIAAAERLIGMVDDDTKIIPGHGLLARKAELVAYRDMLVTVRDRIQALVDEGKPLTEIVAATPLSDIEGDWPSGPQGTERFILMVYYSLTGKLQ